MRALKAKQEPTQRFRLNEPARNEPPKQWLGKSASLLGEYVLRNPLALFTAAALTVGGLVLMGFFLRIGFMPDVDLAGSMALLFAAAIVGLGTLAALVFATVLPGVGMRYLLDEAQVSLAWPAVFATAGPAGLLVTLVVLSPLTLEPAHRPSIWVIVIACLGVAVVIDAIFVCVVHRHGLSLTWRSLISKIGSLVLCSTLWTIGLFQVLQAAIEMGVDSPHPPIVTFFFLAFWLTMIALINVTMARFPLRVSLIAGPVAGIISVVLLAMLTGSYSTVSAKTVKTLGIGELGDTNLVLSADMCQALIATPGALHCEPLADKATVGLLKDVTIVSRIGSNVVAEKHAAEGVPAQLRPRLILRKDAVIAWTMSAGKGR